ncbi:platelet glycoprotein IX-like [Spea bombifrons]|uniref:platelet glycoprotein IX-like n=1 Tax=Spea bombifrons TaxID=233779 RepID=UPI002349C89E|nr:platelet glycoprotein IX-like [Spea bombifrons]
MPPGVRLVAFGIFLVILVRGDICPEECECANATSRGLLMDCSRRNLEKVPDIPLSAEELDLRQNQITSVLPGTFDGLLNLKRLNLSGNPLHCGCDVEYLVLWLAGQDADSGARCVSPATLSGTPVSGALITSCTRPHAPPCSHFLLRDAVLLASLFIAIALTVICLRTLKFMWFSLKVTENDITFQCQRFTRRSSLKRRLNGRNKCKR